MKKVKASVISVFAAIAVYCLVACPGGGAKVGLPAPALNLERLGGGNVNLSDLKGKVVLVNFWATWCEPCREEMPDLEKLSRELEGQPFILLAVNIDDRRATVESFANDHKLSLPILFDQGGTIARSWGTTMYPESYIIDKNGNITDKVLGMVEYPDVMNKVQALIDSK